uniref:TFIIIC_sub6 domain-containing protein n=1 Tax=Steinernema glaseri TaxID=37863 RepID=A0A1I7Z3P5_9BILA
MGTSLVSTRRDYGIMRRLLTWENGSSFLVQTKDSIVLGPEMDSILTLIETEDDPHAFSSTLFLDATLIEDDVGSLSPQGVFNFNSTVVQLS